MEYTKRGTIINLIMVRILGMCLRIVFLRFGFFLHSIVAGIQKSIALVGKQAEVVYEGRDQTQRCHQDEAPISRICLPLLKIDPTIVSGSGQADWEDQK